MKRGQVSFEYLILVGFVTIIIVGIMGVALFYTSSSKDSVKITQVNNFANKIISNAESVYYAGEPSKATITTYLPEGVAAIDITENTLLITLQLSTGTSVIGFDGNVNITGSINPNQGVKKIEILAQEDGVLITQV